MDKHLLFVNDNMKMPLLSNFIKTNHEIERNKFNFHLEILLILDESAMFNQHCKLSSFDIKYIREFGIK